MTEFRIHRLRLCGSSASRSSAHIPGVPSDLLERRADIASAERRVAAASAQVGATSAAYYPLLTLSGAVGFESSSLGSLLASASNFWVTGPVAVATLFDAGRRRANIEQAQAFYQLASSNYRESVLSAFREVEDQLANLRVLEREAQVQDAAVAASERALTLANNRYRGGVTSYLEVITAAERRARERTDRSRHPHPSDERDGAAAQGARGRVEPDGDAAEHAVRWLECFSHVWCPPSGGRVAKSG